MDNMKNFKILARLNRSKFKYRLIDMEPFRSKAIQIAAEDFKNLVFHLPTSDGAKASIACQWQGRSGTRSLMVDSNQLERMAAAIRIYEKVAS